MKRKNVNFYQKLGFNIVKEGTPMQLCNPETMKVKIINKKSYNNFKGKNF